MTVYSGVLSSQRAVGAPLTFQLSGQWTNNLLAVQEGDASAPKIQGGAIATGTIPYSALNLTSSIVAGDILGGAINQSKLAIGSGVVSASSGTYSLLTLGGGSYGFYPTLRHRSASSGSDGVATLINQQAGNLIGSTYLTRIAMNVTNPGASNIMDATQYWVTASKPYDLGDGEIQLFVFLVVDNGSGNIDMAYIASEAPWHYNGKTSIIADFYKKDKGYKRVPRSCYEKQVNGIDLNLLFNTKNKSVLANEILSDEKLYDIEINQAVKNADMVDIPHPFTGNNLTGKTVLILDPVSPVMNELSILHHAGEDITGMLYSKNIVFGNTTLGRSSPAGVLDVSLKWKNT